MNKFEKLVELIVNENTAQAKKIFHDIVVEKSRTIYESLLDETDIDEEDSMEEMEDDVDAEETFEAAITVEEAKQLLDHIDGTLKESDAGDLLQRVAEHFNVEVKGLIPVLESHGDELLEMAYGEAHDMEMDDMEMDDMDDMGGEEEFSGEMDDMGDDMGMDDDMASADDAEIEDRVVDLEDAIDELKAEFDAMADEEDMDDDMDGEDADMEMDDAEDFGDDVTDDEAEDDEAEDDVEESMVREYVEKVTAPKNNETEGCNTTSTVSRKNDMGGSAANIVGGSADEKGGKVSAPKDGGTYQNDPKAKAGKTSFKKKETATNTTDSEKSMLDGPKGR
jgi:hypothetical protein